METNKTSLGKVGITVDKECYDVTKDYDKLVIVEVPSIKKTYISRKPVPAGTELTNREYWIPFSSLEESLVINYNSFKAKYNALLLTLINAVDGVQAQLNAISQTIGSGVVFGADKTQIVIDSEHLTDDIILSFTALNDRVPTSFILYKNAEQVYVETDCEHNWTPNPSHWEQVFSLSDTTSFLAQAVIDGVTYSNGLFIERVEA